MSNQLKTQFCYILQPLYEPIFLFDSLWIIYRTEKKANQKILEPRRLRVTIGFLIPGQIRNRQLHCIHSIQFFNQETDKGKKHSKKLWIQIELSHLTMDSSSSIVSESVVSLVASINPLERQPMKKDEAGSPLTAILDFDQHPILI